MINPGVSLQLGRALLCLPFARQAAAFHHARYHGGFHSAASLAAAHAGMKFAIAHNIPAISQPKKTTPFHHIKQS
jgi:hypothetical protein